MKPKLIAILTLVLLGIIILAQNTHVTTLNLLFWQIGMSQVLIILFSILIGFAFGYLTAVLPKKMKSKSYKR